VAVAVVELDRQGCVGDGDGEGSAGVGATDADALTADRHRSGVIGQPLHPDWLLGRPGRRPGGPCAAQPQHLLPREWVRPGAQQGSGVEVE
jgi:hypothetical protein